MLNLSNIRSSRIVFTCNIRVLFSSTDGAPLTTPPEPPSNLAKTKLPEPPQAFSKPTAKPRPASTHTEETDFPKPSHHTPTDFTKPTHKHEATKPAHKPQPDKNSSFEQDLITQTIPDPVSRRLSSTSSTSSKTPDPPNFTSHPINSSVEALLPTKFKKEPPLKKQPPAVNSSSKSAEDSHTAPDKSPPSRPNKLPAENAGKANDGESGGIQSALDLILSKVRI